MAPEHMKSYAIILLHLCVYEEQGFSTKMLIYDFSTVFFRIFMIFRTELMFCLFELPQAVIHYLNCCASYQKQPCVEELEAMDVVEQAAQLEKDLVAKERETLDVLQELERTKRLVVDLRMRLQKNASEIDALTEAETNGPSPVLFTADSSMVKLNQEKFSVSKIASELTDIRASFESLGSKIKGERTSEVKRVLSENEAVVNNNSSVILSLEDYVMLTQRAREADESSRKRVEEVMLELENAKQSKLELLIKLEETEEEVKTSREVLEDALNRLESANNVKMAVEEALQRWRFEHGKKKNLTDDVLKDGFKHVLSIGEILSRKLMGDEEQHECEIGKQERSNEMDIVSLGQLINRRLGGSACKQHSSKRKKLCLAGLSHLLKNEGKKSMKKKRRQSLAHVNDEYI
ncbi:WEB family protein [Apostasia shenzhenica]|uniref:WEB family protein n=1 Tax=Apostasia shenzhenica TaxID=1088818 RepID=A0A2I0BHG7_9ASPA|nr:WEB family protein [Apostasia shenzhenica]